MKPVDLAVDKSKRKKGKVKAKPIKETADAVRVVIMLQKTGQVKLYALIGSLRVRISKSILRPQLLVGTCVAQLLCPGHLRGDSSLYPHVLHQRKVAVEDTPKETLFHPLSRLPILKTCLLRSVRIERRLRTQVSVSPDGIFHRYLDPNFRLNTQCTTIYYVEKMIRTRTEIALLANI